MTDVRPPCPVCGIEGSNCGPLDGSEDRPHHVQFAEWDRTPPPSTWKSRKTKETVIMGNAVVATARIFEEVPIPHGRGRTSKVLRYTPGHVVPEADAVRLNVKADGTQSSVPTSETATVGGHPLPVKKAAKAPAKKSRKRA